MLVLQDHLTPVVFKFRQKKCGKRKICTDSIKRFRRAETVKVATLIHGRSKDNPIPAIIQD